MGFALHQASPLGQVQLALDGLGSTEIPILSQLGDLGSAGISFYQGDNSGALLSLGGMVIPGLSQIKLVRQAHHLIPNAVFKTFKTELKGMGWVQSHRKNLMDLPFPFHANHPKYNDFVEDQIRNIINNGGGIDDIINLQNRMRTDVQSILDAGWDKLNNYYK